MTYRLLYRAYLVLQIPNDVLVEKLGLDIPPAPELILEEITDRIIRVAWKVPDMHNSVQKHLVLLNGFKGKQLVLLTPRCWMTQSH